MFKFLQDYKLNNKEHSKTQTKKNGKQFYEKRKIEEHFGLSEKETEDLFDIIKRELINEEVF